MIARLQIASTGGPQNIRGWRALFSILVILTFGFQSYVAQTHIHVAPSDFQLGSGAHAQTSGGSHPGKDDPAHCPLCQAVMAGAAAVTPAVAALSQPLLFTMVVSRPYRATVRIIAPRHDWLSRAPPVPEA